MNIKARLTFGWSADPEDSFSAARINLEAQSSNNEYNEVLASVIKNIKSNEDRITGLELLFRKRAGGFSNLNWFINELERLIYREKNIKHVICEIDAFAYGYLKGAKNFDLIVPLSNDPNPDFDLEYGRINKTIKQLEAFEREGRPITKQLKETYMALRSIMVRPSARDERRALASLLISGPSTLDDISVDLGLNYILWHRTLEVSEITKVVESDINGRFCIQNTELPVVVFCLREGMGIDLLAGL